MVAAGAVAVVVVEVVGAEAVGVIGMEAAVAAAMTVVMEDAVVVEEEGSLPSIPRSCPIDVAEEGVLERQT